MANEGRGKILNFILDNIVPVFTVLIVVFLILPIPKFLVDLFMILNISLSIIVLLVVINVPRPSDFQTFPRVVLVETLFGLAINISSTRLILAGTIKGGKLIGQSTMVTAFANIVAGNDIVVGFIIFIILILVQMMVVTKGATRVSEVAARFSLDSMNQKMFDVDNRESKGVIDEAEAERLKEAIRKEIDFYSTMDGSSKFVSGNAKLGIAVTVINLIGGFIIGMVRNNMDFSAALSTYSTLTIGDGLTSQLPSLIISFATGLLVTGTKSDDTFDQQLKKEFTGDGQIYEILGAILIVAGIVLRVYLLAVVGALFIYIGFMLVRGKERKSVEMQQQANSEKSKKAVEQSDAEKIVMLDPLSLEIGYALIPLVDKEKGAELLERITRIRNEARLDMGFDIPKIRIQDNMTLEPNDYSFKIEGIEAGHATVRLNYLMCMDTGSVKEPLEGEKTKDPAFGMDAIWLPEERRAEAEAAGYTVVDPPTIISTHITEIIHNHASEMLDRQSVSEIINKVKEKNPVLIDDVLNNAKVSYGLIEKVFKNLLDENVSIRNYGKILETIADYANMDLWQITAKVRETLGLQICKQYVDADKKIRVMRLSEELSQFIANKAYYPEDGSKPYVAFDPADRRRWINVVNNSLSRINQMGIFPIILCVSSIRQLVRSSLERENPGVVVISDMELYSAGNSISVEIIDEIKEENLQVSEDQNEVF